MIKSKKHVLSLAIGALGLASQGMAQEKEAERTTDDLKPVSDKVVEEVEVYGIRSSIKSSLDIKKNSVNVVDAIMAEDIGKFPDQNIAEALQRMSGVTITRNAGEGQNITVRGLGGDYNVTTINGRRMASEHSSRDFNYDLIAAELLKGVEVYKSPVAKTQEGGIGSVVNIQTRRPLDFSGLTVSGSVKGIYEDRTEEMNPQASFLVSNTFADGTFGALLTAVYSERTLRTDAYQGEGFYNRGNEDSITVRQDVDGNGEFDPAVDNEYGSIIPGYVRYTNWQDTRERIGASLALQWQPRGDVEVNFDSIYSAYDTNGEQYEISFVTYDEDWTPGIPNVTDLGFDDDGLVNALTLSDGAMAELLNTSLPRKTETFQVGNNVAWHVRDNLTLTVDVSHSESENTNNGDNRYIVARGFVDEIRIDQSGGNLLPDITMTPALSHNSPFGAHYSYNYGNEIRDKVTEFKFDGDWAPLDSIVSSVQFGINYGDQAKERDSYRSVGPSIFSNAGEQFERYPQYSPDMSAAENIAGFDLFRLPADVLVAPRFDNFLDGEAGSHPAPWASFDYDKLFAFYESISADAANDLVKAQFRPNDSFTVGESTLAAYVQADLQSELLERPFTLNLGLRAIETTVTSSGYSLDVDAVRFEAGDEPGELQYVGDESDYQRQMDFEDSYTDVLPSLNFKWNLRDDLIYRFSAAKVITRPQIDSLTAYSYLNLREFELHSSNPGLEPMRASQFDTGLEWYFSDYGAVTGTFFLKDIESFIESGRNGTRTIDGRNFAVYSAINGEEGAEVRGTELAYQQSFAGILPGVFGGLGIQLNYTYVDSEYDDRERRAAGLPFRGMPKNSYNVVLYYEGDALQARLAYNWRGKVMTNPDAWGGPSWDADYGQFDFSADYDWTDSINVSLSVNNITNERNWGYILRSDQVSHLARYGRLVNLGVSVNF
ncbi:TonB-dependent receptor [Microbulbifer sp. 2205BS26-8]|uniref:TonB-dependent receptor n=1 Tax=Microbulbifer sp. 2205BS26-8 TaxID=3064386 RepID=UPI00273D8425|nr:TonB-dependent receptor [Microbulbifer sp. 2205BS26-8]MDP5210599.1 TonB-dependent receptor [Microbulbifer sp. 2205BS26-8]